MFDKDFKKISFDLIDCHDTTYRYSFADPDNSLIISIRKTGLINPITVQRVADKYRIVAGFKRTLAASQLGLNECPAFIIQQPKPVLELLMLAIQDNQSVRSLNAVEVSQILLKLHAFFHIDEDTIVKDYLPQLGYGRNPRVLQLYSGLHELPETWQTALIQDQVAIDFAQEMRHHGKDVLEKMWQLMSNCRLGKNRQREFFALLDDVASLENQKLIDFLDNESIKNIQAEERLTPSQKAERLKAWLWEKRYPRYSKAKAQYDALLKLASLPQNCFIQSPPYFEGDHYSAGFSFSSIQEFDENLSALKKAREDGTVQSILDLA